MNRWLYVLVMLAALIHDHVVFSAPPGGQGGDEEAEEGSPTRVSGSYLLTLPGTNWCGLVNRSSSEGLGVLNETDRCCYDHAHCDVFIDPWEKKYDYSNLWPLRITSCECHERFRSCLQATRSLTGDVVGITFFNILDTACINLVKARQCAERTWYIFGCKRYEETEVAHRANVGAYNATVSKQDLLKCAPKI